MNSYKATDAKELELQGCRKFVCPNLSLIDKKGKELNLRDDTIKRAKDMALEYFKKTYHKPHYTSAKHLLPAFLYIASILESERRFQEDIGKVFGMSHTTISKWYEDIIDVLSINLKDIKKEKLSEEDQLGQLQIIGENLKLKDTTIEKAKNLALRYISIIKLTNDHSSIKQLLPAFIYIASIIENDKRTQIDISNVSGISESVISNRQKIILKTLGMKLIVHNHRVLKILENNAHN